MRDVGFLYVLANSAMQGMVKVGKTTRSPAERAAELSAATGLPTPFIVVYEQLFADCTEAEAFVHALLASKGFRVADNREFFSAPVNEVVRAIALAPGAIDEDVNEEKEEEYYPFEPWVDVYEEAVNHRHGFCDYLKDGEEALRLFKQATTLGCRDAYVDLAEMYYSGEGVRRDKNEALKYCKEGVRKGFFYCYWKMAGIYLNASIIEGRESFNSNYYNTEKSFDLYMKAYRAQKESHRLDVFRLDSVLLDTMTMLSKDAAWRNSSSSTEIANILQKVLDFFIEMREPLIELCEKNIENYKDVPVLALPYEQVAQFLKRSRDKSDC